MFFTFSIIQRKKFNPRKSKQSQSCLFSKNMVKWLCKKEVANRLKESDFCILRMEKADIPAVAALEKECFSAPWSEKALLGALESDVSLFLVAKNGSTVIGYIGVSVILDEVYVSNIAVTEPARRMGVAKALLCETERLCREKNCSFISLEVRESNAAARGLYEKSGFSCQGIRKNFYREPRENAVIYLKEI